MHRDSIRKFVTILQSQYDILSIMMTFQFVIIEDAPPTHTHTLYAATAFTRGLDWFIQPPNAKMWNSASAHSISEVKHQDLFGFMFLLFQLSTGGLLKPCVICMCCFIFLTIGRKWLPTFSASRTGTTTTAHLNATLKLVAAMKFLLAALSTIDLVWYPLFHLHSWRPSDIRLWMFSSEKVSNLWILSWLSFGHAVMPGSISPWLLPDWPHLSSLTRPSFSGAEVEQEKIQKFWNWWWGAQSFTVETSWEEDVNETHLLFSTVVHTSIAILSWVVLNQPTRDVDLMVVVYFHSFVYILTLLH